MVPFFPLGPVPHFEDCFTAGASKKRVANLWTEFAARRRDALIANGKDRKT